MIFLLIILSLTLIVIFAKYKMIKTELEQTYEKYKRVCQQNYNLNQQRITSVKEYGINTSFFAKVIKNYRDVNITFIDIDVKLTDVQTPDSKWEGVKEQWILQFNSSKTEIHKIIRNNVEYSLGQVPASSTNPRDLYYWTKQKGYCERVRVCPSEECLSFTGEIWSYTGSYQIGAMGDNIMLYTWP